MLNRAAERAVGSSGPGCSASSAPRNRTFPTGPSTANLMQSAPNQGSNGKPGAIETYSRSDLHENPSLRRHGDAIGDQGPRGRPELKPFRPLRRGGRRRLGPPTPITSTLPSGPSSAAGEAIAAVSSSGSECTQQLGRLGHDRQLGPRPLHGPRRSQGPHLVEVNPSPPPACPPEIPSHVSNRLRSVHSSQQTRAHRPTTPGPVEAGSVDNRGLCRIRAVGVEAGRQAPGAANRVFTATAVWWRTRAYHFGSQGPGDVYSNYGSHSNRMVPVYAFGTNESPTWAR